MSSYFLSAILRASCAIALFGLFSGGAFGQTEKRNSEKVPVVLIHGIGGSDLDLVTRGLWRNGFPNDVLKGFPGNPQNLQFDVNGEPRRDTDSVKLQATKFYDVPGGKNITDLSKFLRKSGFRKDSDFAKSDLFEFAYDFRFSVPQNAGRLKEFIEKIRTQTGKPQVDIVAHSMGGMIAKQYLLDVADAQNVRTLIFVGTPHLGAPKALKVLRYGDDLGIFIIDACKMKRVAHNLPSMFNLLPGKRYFEVGGAYLEDSGDADGDGTSGMLNFDSTIHYLKNARETRCLLREIVDTAPFDRLSAALIDEHVLNFRELHDNWKKPAGVRVFSIVGYAVPTLKRIAEKGPEVKITYTTEGDGTVPLWSAENVDADQTYFLDLKRFKSDHSQMIGEKRVRQQILNLLERGAGVYNDGMEITRPDGKKFQEITRIER